MANPIGVIEQNATFLADGRDPYPIYVLDYMLWESKTVETRSIWQLSDEEIEAVNDTGVVFLRVDRFQPAVCVFFGEICEFEGQNAVFKLSDCNDLPAFVRYNAIDPNLIKDITSAWKLNPEGLKFLNDERYVVLSVVGRMTDVEVFGINPIDEL